VVVLAGIYYLPSHSDSFPVAPKQWVGSIVMATTGLPEEETETSSGIRVLL